MITIYRKDGSIHPDYLARLPRHDFAPDPPHFRGPYATCLECDGPLMGDQQRRGLHPSCEAPYQIRARGEAKSKKLDDEIDQQMRAFIRQNIEIDNARKAAEAAPPPPAPEAAEEPPPEAKRRTRAKKGADGQTRYELKKRSVKA